MTHLSNLLALNRCHVTLQYDASSISNEQLFEPLYTLLSTTHLFYTMPTALSTLTPPSVSRTWQSAPHPTLPLLATACSDKTVRIYSLTSFTLLSTITGGHRRSIRTCAWKPTAPKSTSAPVLATGSFDATAAIWVGNTQQQREDDGGETLERDMSRGGGEDENELGEEEDDDDYHFAVVLEGHDSEIKSLAWSPHGTYLATCSRDKSVWIWESLASSNGTFGYAQGGQEDDDEDNYETVAVLQEHDGDVKCVSWHPDEETCLASASYDEAVRVWREDEADGEWGCVAVLEGHGGTVWCVDWERSVKDTTTNRDRVDPAGENEDDEAQQSPQAVSGPRIVTCSDDKTIRIWRRRPKVPKPAPAAGPRIPSIIRSAGQEEEWYEETKLPQRHERAIYAVAWSKKTGRIVSAGSDGMIVVYEERPVQQSPAEHTNGDVTMQDGSMNGTGQEASQMEWKVVSEIQAAHGVFEINHICWSKRWNREKTLEDEEEVIISTGDDGEVKVWTVD